MGDQNESSHNGSSDRFKYFMIGGAVGAVAALFLAPKSGKETRDFLATSSREGKKAIEQGIKRGEERIVEEKERIETEAKQLLGKARNITTQERDIILSAIEAGKKAYREQKEALSG